MDILTVTCPACHRALRVPDSLAGQLVKCPVCAHTFGAPEQLELLPPEPAPPPPQRRQKEDRPRGNRFAEEDAPDYDDREHAPHGPEKPGKVQAIAIMTLVGGIHACLVGLVGLVWGAVTCVCLLWPGTYYSIVLGILAIIKGSQLLGTEAHRQAPPKGIAIMQIVNIINGDVPNCVMGILSLVFLSERPVARFFRG
jgi:predicted Zn finger-like uncharacterized protein